MSKSRREPPTSDYEELDKYCKERARHVVSGYRNVIETDSISDVRDLIWAELMTLGRKQLVAVQQERLKAKIEFIDSFVAEWYGSIKGLEMTVDDYIGLDLMSKRARFQDQLKEYENSNE